jgi:hypothetical protein
VVLFALSILVCQGVGIIPVHLTCVEQDMINRFVVQINPSASSPLCGLLSFDIFRM